MFGEIVVQFMFSMEEVDLKLRPYDNNHNNRINILKNKDLLPKDIDGILHTLRLNRNNAAHGGYEDVEKAKIQLQLTFKLAVWFMQTYGDWNFKPKGFRMPRKDGYDESITDIAREYEEKYKLLEGELNKLKAEEKDKEKLEKRREQGKKASRDIDLSEEEARRIIDASIGLRYYQVEAIKAVEKAIVEGKKSALINMATGTGKTRTVLGLIYRLLKTNRYRRILFLVDRSSLRDQALDTFKEIKIEDLKTLNQIYNISVLDEKLSDKDNKIHIATIETIFNKINESDIVSPQDYDCLIVDEAHRGYTLDKESEDTEEKLREDREFFSKYNKVIEYFNGFKVAFTATPALHTTKIFGPKVYSYSYRQAVIDGCLVDYEPPHSIKIGLATDKDYYKRKSKVARYNSFTGELINGEELEDNIDFEVDKFNKKIVSETYTRAALEEVSKHINPESDKGKTLIFAVNEAHASMIVRLLKDIFRDTKSIADDDFILKVTETIRNTNLIIKKFKNEKYPNIVVTVDLLATGIDMPRVDKIVFLRRVKSRILYEQMIGRATRTCDSISKTHFEVFDCVGLCEAFEDSTNIKPVAANENTSFTMLKEILEKAKSREEKEATLEKVIAKLQRKKKLMSEKENLIFKGLYRGKTPEEFIKILRQVSVDEAVNEIIKRKSLIEYLDEGYSNEKIIASLDKKGEVLFQTQECKSEEYIKAFKQFIEENKNNIKPLEFVCKRPHKLTKENLKQLKAILHSKGFSEEELKRVWKELKNEESAADIIAFIRQQVLGSPLESNEERVKKALSKIKNEYSFTEPQENWINRMEKVMLKEVVIDRETLDTGGFKVQGGGFDRLNEKVFDGKLGDIMKKLKIYMFEE